MQSKFLETICLAVLRHLVAACERDTSHRLIQKTVYILTIRGAVKYVSADGNFRNLNNVDKDEVKEWVSQLDTLYKKMQNVSASRPLRRCPGVLATEPEPCLRMLPAVGLSLL